MRCGLLQMCIRDRYYTQLRTRRQSSGESLQEFEASIDRLIRLAYPEVPEDFQTSFAMQTFIDGIGDCELQQVLRMARHLNSSEALVHALEFEAAKSASCYINGFVPSRCSQKIPVSHCRYDGCRKIMLADKHFQSSNRVATVGIK